MGEIHGWSDEQKNEEFDLDYGPRYCDKCEFEAADGYELEGHIWSEHDEEAAKSFACQFCGQNFSSLKDLMSHKKIDHSERVSLCYNFSNGTCPYEDDKCWFIYKETVEEQKIYECSICRKTYQKFNLYKRHMKLEHTEKVQNCKKYIEGACSYEEKLLLFIPIQTTKQLFADPKYT